MSDLHFGVETRVAVALRPRTDQRRVAVLADAAREKEFGIARQARHRQIAAVTRTVNAEPRGIDLWHLRQKFRGVQAVLHVAHAPVIIVGVFERESVSRRAAIVRTQNRVPLRRQVLDQNLPRVPKLLGRPAVRMHQRRAVGMLRFVKQARDLQPVVTFIDRLLGHDHRTGRERGRIRKRQLLHAPRRHVNALDVGRRQRVFILDVEVRAVGTPLRTRIDSASRFDLLDSPRPQSG
ncbi:MAG: hypothetical protein PGMFKBFP_00353 [Anaerolineales bacterium]|nr:hypothetical protein [Anaerolineales bacterium]